MNRLKLALLGGVAIAVPLASLASPTVYIPLGSANEILIVDAATDKAIGKISGVTNTHGLSITPNGEYLVAGSNTEEMADRSKMAGHGKMSGKPGQSKSCQFKTGQQTMMGGSSKMVGKSEAPGYPGVSKPGQSKIPKPKGMSEADHKQHHPQQRGGQSMMMGGSSQMAGKPKAPSHAGTSKPGQSKMLKPKGMSEADHKKHHAPQVSGAMMGAQSQMAGKSEVPGYAGVRRSEVPGYAGVRRSEVPSHADAGKHGQSKMLKPKGMSEADHKKHHAPQTGGLLPAVGISRVSLIRVANNKLEGRIKVRGMAHHILVTPDGRYAVSTHTTAGTISLIDLATKKIFRTIYTGPQPNYVVVTKDSERMYVSNAGNNTLSVIDTKNWIVSRNIIVGKGPEHIVMSPDEKFIYTNNTRSGTISKVSLEQLKVVKTFTIGNNPHGIDISSNGKTLFASTKKDNKLVAVDVKTGKVRTLKLKPAPYHVKVIGNTGKIYVSSREKPFIWVVDAKQFKVMGKIRVRGEGHQMVVVN